MRLLIKLAVTTLFVTCLHGCAASIVKNENSATPPERGPYPAIESPSTVRRLLAQDMEEDAARSGFRVKITVSGQDNTVITFESADNTREAFEDLAADAKRKARWQVMGFKRVVYKNGTHEWGLDLK